MDKNNYKNIFGDTEKIINAIQKFLEKGKEDEENLDKGTDLAKEAIIEIIKNGIDIAMNKFN